MTTNGVCTVTGFADGRSSLIRDLILVVGTVSVTGISTKTTAPPLYVREDRRGGGRAICTEAPVGHGRGTIPTSRNRCRLCRPLGYADLAADRPAGQGFRAGQVGITQG